MEITKPMEGWLSGWLGGSLGSKGLEGGSTLTGAPAALLTTRSPAEATARSKSRAPCPVEHQPIHSKRTNDKSKASAGQVEARSCQRRPIKPLPRDLTLAARIGQALPRHETDQYTVSISHQPELHTSLDAHLPAVDCVVDASGAVKCKVLVQG